MRIPFVLALFASLPALAADPLSIRWAGYLEDGDVPFEGPASVVATVTDSADTVVFSLSDDRVIVGGALDLDLVFSGTQRTLRLGVVVNGNDFGESDLVIDWASAAVVNRSVEADAADDARGIGDVDDPFSVDDIAGRGVHVAHVEGFPADFLDGDQGIDLSPSARFVIANGTIQIADGSLNRTHLTGTLAAADLANDSIANVDIANDGLNSSDFNLNIPLSALAAGTLRANNFSVASQRTPLFQIVNAFCAERGRVVADATCSPADDCAGADRRDCNGACSPLIGGDFSCDNTPVGDLVFKP